MNTIYKMIWGDGNIQRLPDEELENIRMLTQFDVVEVNRLHDKFLRYSEGSDGITGEQFSRMKCLRYNPLNDRILKIFGFDEKKTLSFKEWVRTVAEFNCHNLSEQNIKIAFRLQDMNDDGVISKDDLIEYMNRITTQQNGNQTINEESIESFVSNVIDETSSDGQIITFNDFQQVIRHTDFRAKLRLPI